MNYTNLMLFGIGMLGVFAHCLVEINKLNKKGTFKFVDYFKTEWASISLSLIVIIVSIICKAEITELEKVGKYLGIGFFFIGYGGQSLLFFFMGKASKVIGVNVEDGEIKQPNATPPPTPVILLLISASLFLLSGCANEAKFVRFHDKCIMSKDSAKIAIPAKYYTQWYPVKETTTTIAKFIPGKTDTLFMPGETVYVDCADAVTQALDDVSKRHVAVQCPPAKVINHHDTVYWVETKTVEKSDGIIAARGELSGANAKLAIEVEKNKNITTANGKLRTRLYCTWGALAVIAVVAVYGKIKGIV